LAARIGAFEASLCYAKITPAALHRGEFGGHRREGAEAPERKPESGLRLLLARHWRRSDAGPASLFMAAS